MNKYSKQKLNERNKNTAKQTKRRRATFDIFQCISLSTQHQIFYTILFIVSCNECLSAEFVGQTSVPYERISKRFDLINSNNASS